MELAIAIAAIVATVVAFAHALDVRQRNKELFNHCVELAKANGALLTERNALLADAKQRKAVWRPSLN